MSGTLWLLFKMFVKSQMEYRGAFFLDRLAQIVTYSASYAAIWVLLLKFDTLGGWHWPELALLLSFQLLAHAIGGAFSYTQFRDMEELVRKGTLDTLMVKPMNPWLYITFSKLNIGYVGHIVLGVGLMVWAVGAVDVAWSFWHGSYLIVALMSSAMVGAAMITMIGASSMVLVQSRYLYTILFGFYELTRYPLTIFPAALQWLLLTVIPIGFLNFVPVAFYLGKEIPIFGAWGGVLALVVGPAWAVLAMMHWRFCIARYQGAGG